MFDYFRNKKVMIVVPHQDDELNIVGGLLVSNYFNLENVYLVFGTNGDYLCNYHRRLKEVIKIAKKIHLPQKNILFLGYPDQHIKENNHIYNTYQPNVFKSKKGNSYTFCHEPFFDYHYQKYNEHTQFNYENMLSDYVDLINQYRPEVFFAIDFDSHPDHRAISLVFEKALGIVLKQNVDYKPLVYKAFAYPTYYKGIKDFNNINLESTKFNLEPYSIKPFQNPYYSWDERVRFSNNLKNTLISNPVYRLLRIYRSQMILKRAYSIINSDTVFWQRRTDNLCLNSNITVSSGVAAYLNDFMLFDVKKVTKGDSEYPLVGNNSWIPDADDSKKEIKIKFPENKEVEKMVLYQNVEDDSKIKVINIETDSGFKETVYLTENKTEIFINENCCYVKINVIESIGTKAGFSEIEIFEPSKSLFEYFNIDINNTFGLQQLYISNLMSEDNIKFYYYDGNNVKYLNKTEILLNNKIFDKGNIEYGENIFSLKFNENNTIKLNIKRLTKLVLVKNNIKFIFNNLVLKMDIFISRVFNKIDRMLKKL